MYNRWILRNIVQVFAGILLVIGATWLVTYSSDRQMEKNVRPGWTMVRTPGNLQTIVMYQGYIWAGGVNGLFKFDPNTAEILPLPQGAGEFGFIYDLLVDQSGKLWVIHQQGVTFFDGTKWEKYDGLPIGRTNKVTALLQDRAGEFWMGLQDGILYRGVVHPLNTGPIDVLYQDQQGRIWAGSSDYRKGGLACFDGQEWTMYGSAEGLVHPAVNCVMQTSEGTVWIGTGFANAGGANYITGGGAMASMLREDGLPGDKVRQIYQDKAGNLWFCSEYDGVALFKNGKKVIALTTADGLASQEVKKIIQDDSGVYWLATAQGLNRISAVF